MGVHKTSIQTSSNGIWQGDNPLHYAFPLLIIQTLLILSISRLLARLFKPLHQPRVIAEMLGGILLGPSAFGRNQLYLDTIFPKWSTPTLESVASIGLLFFLFLVGLELDLNSIRRSGWRAFAIAVAGISFTFTLGVAVAVVFRKSIDGADKVGFPQYLVFMGVALSITAFPVLARVLTELKLLSTSIGETAMAAAAINDVAAWISLALAVALAGKDNSESENNGARKSLGPLASVYVMLSGLGFLILMIVVVKPAMKWVERRCSAHHGDAYVCLTLGGVLAAGLVTDFIGIHAIFGGFIFGLTIPKGGAFAVRLIEKIEDFVTGLLLPLYFASSGLKTDIAKLNSGVALGLLALVTTVACVGKILGTFAVAMVCKIPARESLTLGVLMNTKGLVELIVLNIGREKKVLNDEAFAILVLMALITTFLTTPTVMAIYKPARAAAHRRNKSVSDELRVLACVHGPSNIPSLINLVESTRSANKHSRLKLYVMHLVEFSERSSSIVMAQRLRRNNFPLITCLRHGAHVADQVAMAFQTYSQLGRVSVRPATSVSPLTTMHEDICHVAEEKTAAMIVLPFHKQWNGEDVVDDAGNGWRGVNQRVLKEAPCTVAVLVDRGFSAAVQNVCVLVLGGPDDGEAVELGGRMAEHPAVKVAVVRFVEKEMCYSSTDAVSNISSLAEKENAEGALAKVTRSVEGKVELIEKTTSNIIDEVLEIGTSGDYGLIIVGQGSSCPDPTTMGRVGEYSELGPIGDLLASSGRGIVSSVLVVQQKIGEEIPILKVSLGEENDGKKISNLV